MSVVFGGRRPPLQIGNSKSWPLEGNLGGAKLTCVTASKTAAGMKRFVPAVLFVPIFTEGNKGNEDENKSLFSSFPLCETIRSGCFLFPFHCGGIFATARGAVALGAMKQGLLRGFDVGVLA